MPAKPERVVVRSYQVGFGDCYLLSFVYGPDSERHVLIDFGSTSLPKDAPNTRMVDIAKDIKERTKGKLDAVVATHRHRDHISGFETRANGKGSGDIIRSLQPKVVVQPWTEDPELEEDATAPKARLRSPNLRLIAALGGMNAAAERLAADARSMRYLQELGRYIAFHGENNVKNLNALKNLMAMGKKGKSSYVHAGEKSGLEEVLPGVKIHVIGPPTVEQHDAVRKQRSKHPDQFWLSQAAALRRTARAKGKSAPPLFPRHVASKGPNFPIEARWLVYKARTIFGEQLLQIVTMLDKAMNNTSVILVFEVGKKFLLFPGDAQWENWEFALKKYKPLLENVDLYKVGHHGSLNATPKDLWKMFKKRGSASANPKRMQSLMSTMPGKHGDESRKTEVPRKPLVAELKRDTNHFSTTELPAGVLSKDFAIKLS